MDKMKDLRRAFDNKFRGDRLTDIPLIYDATNTYNHVNEIKSLCGEIRKLGSLGLITNTVVNDDKKPKKKSLDGLTKLFDEKYNKLPEKNILKSPLWNCYNSFNEIKKATNVLEQEINSQVIDELAAIEDRCVEIQDANKKLQHLMREKSNLEERLTKAQEQFNSTLGGDESRKRTIEAQINEMNSEIDIASDQYLHKIFQFESSDYQTAEIFKILLEQQKIYHDNCSAILTKKIYECHQTMENDRQLLCFKVPLKNHLIETERIIAYPLEHCVKRLISKEELQQEGLFRISGSKTKSDLLYEIMNMMIFHKFKDIDWPANVVADTLKRYLRLMPTQLLGCVDLKLWTDCYELSLTDPEKAMDNMRNIVFSMTSIYRVNLRFLLHFLTKVIAEDQYNKMNVQNICTVFVPNLFNSTLNTNATISLDNSACFKYVLESLLIKFNYFFPDTKGLNQTDSEIKVEKRQKRRIKPDFSGTSENEQNFRSEKCRPIYNSSILAHTASPSSKAVSSSLTSKTLLEVTNENDEKPQQENLDHKIDPVKVKKTKSLKEEDFNLIPSQYLSLPSTKSIQSSRKDKIN